MTQIITSDVLATLVRGDAASWDRCPTFDPAGFVRAADAHGVLPLLAARAADAGVPHSACVLALRDQARAHAAIDLVRERELAELIDAFDTAGIEALLIKGADLAYSLYERPDLRPRTDTDLLVSEPGREAAAEVLRACGYERVPQSGGDLLMYQAPWAKRRQGAVVHVVDLHWRLTNPQRFASVLEFGELARDSEPRPGLAAPARGLAPVHALLLACVHRIAHHFDSPRLIWTHDIHMLSARLGPDEWSRFGALAGERGAAAACLRSLEAAGRDFETRVPSVTERALREAARNESGCDAYFSASTPHVSRVWGDFTHLPTWRARVKLTRQHLFPPSSYMREVYGRRNSTPLVLLYVARILKGSRRWLSRS